jgi:hypothetical protein
MAKFRGRCEEKSHAITVLRPRIVEKLPLGALFPMAGTIVRGMGGLPCSAERMAGE